MGARDSDRKPAALNLWDVERRLGLAVVVREHEGGRDVGETPQ